MVKPTLNRPPNAGRMAAADINRNLVNARGSKQTTQVVQVIQPTAPPAQSTVSVTLPLKMAGNVISLPQATAAQSGYLLAADWTTFNAKMTNPMTTAGDLIVGGASGSPGRLGIGANTYVLTSNGTTASWQASGAGVAGLFAGLLVPPPAIATFTALNLVTATAAQASGNAILMSIPDSPGNWQFYYKAAPVAPYSLIAYLKSTQFKQNQTSGIYLYDSSGGQIIGLEYFTTNAGAAMYSVRHLTSPTVSVATFDQPDMAGTASAASGWWAKLDNDGANLHASVSLDGENWRVIRTEAVGSFVSPDSVAFGGISAAGSGVYYVDLSVLSWQVV